MLEILTLLYLNQIMYYNKFKPDLIQLMCSNSLIAFFCLFVMFLQIMTTTLYLDKPNNSKKVRLSSDFQVGQIEDVKHY